MNMILHGIEAPNIIHANTVTENLADIQEKNRFDVVTTLGRAFVEIFLKACGDRPNLFRPS
jgi:hypothetical protein